ncbi:MAG: restriction endonuclease subunit S [Thauera sp.]|nr:restriction endonuclease subunit S [Thauera sp.]
MSFPRYPEYKDSGVEWLGEVPGHWSLRPLWSLFRRTKRTGFENEQLLSVYRDHGVVPKASRDDNNNKPSDDLSTYQLVDVGDLAINKMKAWQGSVAVSEHRGIVSPAYFVYEGTHSEDGRYLHHLMRSPRYVGACHALSKGIRVNQWDLDPTYHSRLPVLLPPKAEQACIAAFLDRETAKIDALVAEQQNLIALLKEKRQALISHAVTKGLDPDVPMKDSGVVWLGEVPAHWSVGKTGYYLAIVAGFAFSSAGFSLEQSDARLLRGINVGVGRIKWEEVVYWKRVVGDGLEPYELKVDDLVIGLDRPLIAEGVRIARISEADLPCLLLQRVAALHPRPSMHSAYIYYLLASDMFVAHFAPETTGVSVPHISPDQIGQFVIPIPPLPEQVEITDHVISESEKIEVLMCEAKASIELLQERRTALISAAVTGKIDVRHLAVATADPTPEPA